MELPLTGHMHFQFPRHSILPHVTVILFVYCSTRWGITVNRVLILIQLICAFFDLYGVVVSSTMKTELWGSQPQIHNLSPVTSFQKVLPRHNQDLEQLKPNFLFGQIKAVLAKTPNTRVIYKSPMRIVTVQFRPMFIPSDNSCTVIQRALYTSAMFSLVMLVVGPPEPELLSTFCWPSRKHLHHSYTAHILSATLHMCL